MEISRKCPQESSKGEHFAEAPLPGRRLGANGAMTKRHETVGAIAKRPLDAPRYYSGHGEGPTSSIRPPSHAWRARQDGKSGRRGASGTKRPLGRSAAPTESPLHAPRACPTLRDSLSPHAGIGGNAWGTAPSSKRRPNVGRFVVVVVVTSTVPGRTTPLRLAQTYKRSSTRVRAPGCRDRFHLSTLERYVLPPNCTRTS